MPVDKNAPNKDGTSVRAEAEGAATVTFAEVPGGSETGGSGALEQGVSQGKEKASVPGGSPNVEVGGGDSGSSGREDPPRNPETTELESYSEQVQRRISKLTGRLREAERREAAALEYAKSLQGEREHLIQRNQQVDAGYLHQYEARVVMQEQTAKRMLETAIHQGDTKAQIEAQQMLAEVAADRRTLNQTKAQQPPPQQQPQPVQQQQPQPVQQAPQPDARATAWAAQNKWFGSDEPMTLTAFAIHKQLVEAEGLNPTADADEYYRELDKRIKAEFPHKFESNGQRSPVAGGSRQPAGQPQNRNELKLTASQVAIAKKLGVPLQEYAKAVIKLNQDKH